MADDTVACVPLDEIAHGLCQAQVAISFALDAIGRLRAARARIARYEAVAAAARLWLQARDATYADAAYRSLTAALKALEASDG